MTPFVHALAVLHWSNRVPKHWPLPYSTTRWGSIFSTCRFTQWVAAKYKDPKLMTKRDWVKVHLMCGVKTNIVTAVEITDRYAGDSTYFKPLVDKTAENFTMQEVSADKAYLSAANLQTVVGHNAMPYIPFKSNSKPTWGLGPQRQLNQTIQWRRKSNSCGVLSARRGRTSEFSMSKSG